MCVCVSVGWLVRVRGSLGIGGAGWGEIMGRRFLFFLV